MPRDGFLRETFVLPRTDARDKAKEWFDRWPKQAYWTEIESWFERPGRRDRVHDPAAAGGGLSIVPGVISRRRARSLPAPAGRPGLRSGHLSIDMQPQPMQSVSPSRSFFNWSMRRSRSSRQARREHMPSPRASACGPRAVNRASAAISASGMPTSCATRMTGDAPQHVAAVAALVAAGAMAADQPALLRRNAAPTPRRRCARPPRRPTIRCAMTIPLDLNLS